MKNTLLPSALLVLALAGCATTTYPVMGGQAHLDCQGEGTTTVLRLAGRGRRAARPQRS